MRNYARYNRSTKRKKSKVGNIANIRGGFVPSKPTWGAVRGSATKIMKDAAKRQGIDIDRVNTLMKAAKLPTSAQVRKTIVGTVYSVGEEYISGGGKGRVPFLQSDNVKNRNLGSVQTKRHYTKFEYGKPTTSTLRSLAKLNGTSRIDRWNTEYDANYKTGTAGRDHLTMNGGFNRKLVAMFKRQQHLVQELYDVYNLDAFEDIKNKLQTNYLCVKSMYRTVKIMNSSRYLKGKYTIKLYKSLESNEDPQRGFELACYNDAQITANVQVARKMPIKYALDGFINEGNEGASKVWLDPKVSLDRSPTWARNYELVKSFSKWLGPGDLWEFHDIMYAGAGIDAGQLHDAQSITDGTLGYLLVIEAVGQEVAGCYAPNSGENFIGKAPVYCQLEFSMGGEYINNPHSALSSWANASTGGIITSNHLIRSFSKNQTAAANDKIFNVAISNITDDPTNTANGKLFIPVMSDSSIQYAQRAREGGTGGDEN